MTQTTTAQPLSIPAEGLRHEAGNVVITAIPTPQAGYRIQVRINGDFQPHLSSSHTFQWDALRAWAALIEQYPAQPEPTPTAPAAERPIAAIPGNVGTTIRISDPSHIVLAVAALNPAGIVEQGGKPGQATRTQLRSLAKKHYLDLIFETGRSDARKVIAGGRITAQGRRRLAELTAADREAAEHAARLATALNITVPAPVAA